MSPERLGRGFIIQRVTVAHNRHPIQYRLDGLRLQNVFPHLCICFGKVGPEFVPIIDEMTLRKGIIQAGEWQTELAALSGG